MAIDIMDDDVDMITRNATYKTLQVNEMKSSMLF
jgi:hypothetical protein